MSVTAQKDWWDQSSRYHADRAPHSKSQVGSVLIPQMRKYLPGPAQLRVTDLACGAGSIAAEFAAQATASGYGVQRFTLIDVVKDNIEAAAGALKPVLPASKVGTFLANGSDFGGYKGPKANFLYCWDAMVHFDIVDIVGYMRTLKDVAEGIAFFHHSNLGQMTHDIRHNPHHRNFMTKDTFHQICISCGHTVLEQRLIDWGDMKALDCFTTIEVHG